MKNFLGWNLYLSYSEAADKAARKQGWAFLGYGQDCSRTEVKVYRMWKMKDKRKELERREKKKEKFLEKIKKRKKKQKKKDAARRGSR